MPSVLTARPGVPQLSSATQSPASGTSLSATPSADVGGQYLHHGVGQVPGQGGDGRGQRAGRTRHGAGHDQHRQVR